MYIYNRHGNPYSITEKNRGLKKLSRLSIFEGKLKENNLNSLTYYTQIVIQD